MLYVVAQTSRKFNVSVIIINVLHDNSFLYSGGENYEEIEPELILPCLRKYIRTDKEPISTELRSFLGKEHLQNST